MTVKQLTKDHKIIPEKKIKTDRKNETTNYRKTWRNKPIEKIRKHKTIFYNKTPMGLQMFFVKYEHCSIKFKSY